MDERDSDLTPLGRVYDRIAGMGMDELATAARTDPEVQATIAFVEQDARRPADDHGCSGPGYCTTGM